MFLTYKFLFELFYKIFENQNLDKKGFKIISL